jgi:hypothetical protein
MRMDKCQDYSLGNEDGQVPGLFFGIVWWTCALVILWEKVVDLCHEYSLAKSLDMYQGYSSGTCDGHVPALFFGNMW